MLAVRFLANAPGGAVGLGDHIRAGPEPRGAGECHLVVALAATFGERVDVFGVAAAEHGVLGTEDILHHGDCFIHPVQPAFAAVALAGGVAQRIHETRAPRQAQDSDLQRNDDVIDDERRAGARAEAEEEHAAFLIVRQCLHGGVIDESHRALERLVVIEVEPAAAEIERFPRRASVADQTGKAE
jgi:hypothetical protein